MQKNNFPRDDLLSRRHIGHEIVDDEKSHGVRVHKECIPEFMPWPSVDEVKATHSFFKTADVL